MVRVMVTVSLSFARQSVQAGPPLTLAVKV